MNPKQVAAFAAIDALANGMIVEVTMRVRGIPRLPVDQQAAVAERALERIGDIEMLKGTTMTALREELKHHTNG